MPVAVLAVKRRHRIRGQGWDGRCHPTRIRAGVEFGDRPGTADTPANVIPKHLPSDTEGRHHTDARNRDSLSQLGSFLARFL
jgi:hypothetical protein